MNGFLRRRFSLVLFACLGTSGCAAALKPADPAAPHSEALDAIGDLRNLAVPSPPVQNPAPEATPYSPYLTTPYSAQAEALTNTAPAHTPASRPAVREPDAMQKVMAELEALGPIDPAVQQQLLADLRQTDPALWPMMLQTFRAGMAYRQRVSNTTPSPQQATRVERTIEKVASAPKVEPPATPVLPPTSMLDAAATSLNPRGSSTPGLSFPATAMLQAAMTAAQQQAANAAEPAVPSDDPPAASTGAIRTVAHTEPTTTDEKKSSADDEDDKFPAAKTDWQQAVSDALTDLETQTAEPPTSAQEVSRHVWQRVLCLAAGRRDDALKPIPGIAAAEQDFWSEQIFALATYLDSEKVTDPARRAAAAAQHLSKATARLSEASTLAVKNLSFCTEVSSYGVYQKFKTDEFKAGQPLILYAEVENFKSDESSKGFHTALRSSYQILDAQGRRVAENDLALTEEYCQNRRRDYFIRYFLSIPERIYVGKYTLQLTIVDTLSQKIGQSTIDFTVVEK